MDRVQCRLPALAGALLWTAFAAAGCSTHGPKGAPAPGTAALIAPADAGPAASPTTASPEMTTASTADAGDAYHVAGQSIAQLDKRIGEIKSHAPTFYNLSAGDRAELKALIHAEAAMLHATGPKPLKPDKTRDPALDITGAAPKDGGAK